MIFYYLLMRKKISKTVFRLIYFIEERRWSALNESILSLSTYDESIRREVLFTKRMTMNLSYILNLALVSDPPYGVIKSILNIEPILSPSLVSMPDVFGNLPLHIACKLGLQVDIIRLLLKYDNTKTTFRSIDSHNYRTVLHYVTLSALFNHSSSGAQRGEEQEEGGGTVGEKETLTHSTNASSSCGGARNLSRRRPSQSPPKLAVDEELQCNNDGLTEVDFENFLVEENFLPRAQSHEKYVKYVHLIKFLCKDAPQLVCFRDIRGVTALSIAKLARSKVKKIRMKGSLLTSDEDKLYYKKVNHVYKILKKTHEMVSKKQIVVLDDDLRSDCAQCGTSTAWSLQLLEEGLITRTEKFSSFIHPKKEIV